MATEELRKTILQQSDTLTFKQRFGLFSQPISTAVGDDGPYKTKIHQQNKPQTQLRNVQTKPNRVGQVNSSFFSPIASLASSNIKDVYIDVGRRLIKEEHDAYHSGMGEDKQVFKPASGFKGLNKSAYTYSQQKPPALDPKRHRNSEGQVVVQPRNVQTSPMSKVDKTFFKFPAHMTDPYGRQTELQNIRRKKAREMEKEAPFKGMSYGPRLFHKPLKVYGEDVKLEAKTPKETKFNIMDHEAPFKPSNPNKHGLYGYLAPFPPYKQNPPVQKKRDKSKETAEKKDEFKRMNADLSRPSPSITTNPINLRRYISHSFSHRM